MYFLYFLFSIYSFLPPIYKPKKKKKKKLFFSLLVHTPTVTLFPTISFPVLPLFYILTLLLPILFCINFISFSHSIHIFPTQNCEYSLSLSLSLLSFGEFLFFLIILIKVDGFILFYFIFLISHQKVFYFPFTVLVEF